MKKKEQLKQIIKEFHSFDCFSVKSRELNPPFHTEKIIALFGSKGCGKSSILHNMVNQLTYTIDKTKILFLNFADERVDLEVDELDLVIESFSELYPYHNLNECYFFFDEIQNVAGWEKFIHSVHDTTSKNIFIAGMSDISESLRAITRSFEVYPLSFSEYLQFEGIAVDLYAPKSLAAIQNAVGDFLKYSGFSDDTDNALENALLLDLKRDFKEISYHQSNILILDNGTISEAIQVANDIKQQTLNGLVDACKKFNLNHGIIVTYDSEDELVQEGIKIKIIPFAKWHILNYY